MVDMLSGVAAFQAILHVLQPGYSDLEVGQDDKLRQHL